MTKGTKSTKTASKAPKVNKPVESNTKEEKSSTEKINQNKSSQENLMRAKQNLTLNIRWLWLVISILFFGLICCAGYLYLENQKLSLKLTEVAIFQKKNTEILNENNFEKRVGNQFDEMYLKMITPDLERKTKHLEDQITGIESKLINIPTIEKLISEVSPSLNSLVLDLETKLNRELSEKFENLNNLEKSFYESLTPKAEVDVDMLSQEIANMKTIIEKIKNDVDGFSKKINEINKKTDDFLELVTLTPSGPVGISDTALYQEVQDLLRIIPDMTTRAIREEYIADMLLTSNNQTWGRIKAFFGSKIVSRSLTPKEGSSIDAIMSRVERDLKDLNILSALKELRSLPDSVEEIFFPLIERVERLLEAPESTLKKE